MIQSFRNQQTEDVFNGRASKKAAKPTSTAFVFGGRMTVPTTWKSRTITKAAKESLSAARAPEGFMRKLPTNRPPTHPGEMLLEDFLKPLNISQTDFAQRIGVSYPRLNELIHGKRGVTPDTALRLAQVLRMPADFWLGLQQDWDLWHAMRSPEAKRIEKLEPLSA